jgi:hypothetical protein
MVQENVIELGWQCGKQVFALGRKKLFALVALLW